MRKNEPYIAIIGRPNVGKSTLFNRLSKSRQAIVHHQPGITRDRIYSSVNWIGHNLKFIDTGGYIPDDLDTFNAAIRTQAKNAVQEADLLLLLVDGRDEPTATDKELAQIIRKSNKPHCLVINKCDTKEHEQKIYQYAELGFDTLMPISALNGRLTGDLLDFIVSKLDLSEDKINLEDRKSLRIAIVGMPNVGKSSLTNALLQREQTIVTPIAGTTRDSIDTDLIWYGKNITLVDTAGLRKKSKIKESVEYYSTLRTQRAIASAEIVLVLIDAEKGFGHHDKAIIKLSIESGKGILIVVNKWDLVVKETNTIAKFQDEMVHSFKSVRDYPIVFISAKNKQRISKILDYVWNINLARQQRLNTKSLNQWLDKTYNAHPPPAIKGKLIKFKFVNQVTTAPPVFVLFCNRPRLIPMAYRRYLENELRKKFNFSGVPIKLSFRKK